VLQVFVTPPDRTVPGGQPGQSHAVESGDVTSFIVEASEYPDLVALPGGRRAETVVNETVEILGARPKGLRADHRRRRHPK